MCGTAGLPNAALAPTKFNACSDVTNNVLNPFTPYGDCSLIRIANLYANIVQPWQRLHFRSSGFKRGRRTFSRALPELHRP